MQTRSFRFPLVASLFLLASALSVAAPRLAPVFLGLLGLVLVGLAWRRGARWRELAQPRILLALFLAASVYTLLSAVWSAVPGTSLEKAALFGAFSLVTLGAVASIDRLNAAELRSIAHATIAGAFVGAAYVLLEVLTEGRITVSLMNLLSVFRPENAKHVRIEDGIITDINMSRFNHHATMLVLFLWPMLLLMKETLAGPRRGLIAGLFLVSIVVAVFLSEHNSSQLAIIVSLFAWLLAKTWPRMTIRGMALLWCLGFIAIIPLVHLAYDAGLHKAESLLNSFRARIIIWDYTRERALNSPWLGIGAGATLSSGSSVARSIFRPASSSRAQQVSMRIIFSCRPGSNWVSSAPLFSRPSAPPSSCASCSCRRGCSPSPLRPLPCSA